MTEAIPDNIVPMKGRKCPMCGKRGTQKYRPFCSKRCADLDLSKWLNESYKIPDNKDDELDDEAFADDC